MTCLLESVARGRTSSDVCFEEYQNFKIDQEAQISHLIRERKFTQVTVETRGIFKWSDILSIFPS